MTEQPPFEAPQPQGLNELIGEVLMLATRDFQERLDRDLAARGISGIRPRHRSVFLYLGHHGPSRAVDLADAAGIRPQSMMKAVHELEQLGWVKREADPGDSRAKLIHFTAAGLELIDELRISTRAVWREYARRIGEQPLRDTIAGLQSLLETDHNGVST